MGKLYYLLLIPVVRFLINLNHFFYLRKALRKQLEFSLGWGENEDEEKKRKGEKAGNWLQDHQLEIKKRVLRSGVSNQFITHMDDVGFGYLEPKGYSPLDNLLLMNKKIMESSRNLLMTAKGHYKIQAWLSLSPLFWIELIVFLPREILKMVGFDGEKKVSKILLNIVQLLYWAVSIITALKLIK